LLPQNCFVFSIQAVSSSMCRSAVARVFSATSSGFFPKPVTVRCHTFESSYVSVDPVCNAEVVAAKSWLSLFARSVFPVLCAP
jgi:hypothetical protein